MSRVPRSLFLLAVAAATNGFSAPEKPTPAPVPRAAPVTATPPAPATLPSDRECGALGDPQRPFFPAGETLEYELDALGAEAGKLSVRVLETRGDLVPVEVTATTNAFFSKVRRVKATATSFLHPRTLRPRRYVEDASENDVLRYADVSFSSEPRQINVDYKIGAREGKRTFRYVHDALDPAGAIFLLRHLPLKTGTKVCFDAYGIRNMWRVHGQVIGKERVSLKIGEFKAWHLKGEAVRVEDPRVRREIHLWISDDARRLPLAALGVIDLGAVRATLTRYARPDGSKRAAGEETLKW